MTRPERRGELCGVDSLGALTAFLLMVAASLGFGAHSVAASGLAVEGVDRARILPPPGAEISPYSNVGYRLVEATNGEIAIEIDASPLRSLTPFEPPPLPDDDAADDEHAAGDLPLRRLVRAVTLGAGTELEASARLLGWIARNIAYDLDREAPQDAASVLARRSGYCTGLARLAVALSTAAGLEAREVAGYVVGEATGGPHGFHRWIETRFADLGWVDSDPLHSHHYVPATYVRLASEELDLAEGLDGLLLERRDGIETVDAYPYAGPGIRARRLSERRIAAALQVRVEDRASGLALLEGHSTRWTHSLIDGKTTFVGLEPGEYHLRLVLAGTETVERRIRLAPRQRAAISFAPHRAEIEPHDVLYRHSVRPDGSIPGRVGHPTR
ncbi:MAG: transglutaminase-like domain-containing protein [Acidobacteriota bacterium]